MKTIEQEKRGIKRIIRMQFISLALIITAGGIIYGINTGKWSSAFGTTITFLALISPLVPLTYMAVLNRLEKYSDSQSSVMKTMLTGLLMAMLCIMPDGTWAEGTKSGEKAYFKEMRGLISPDRIKTIDDLYRKWQEGQAGRSKAVLIDLRTEAEFASGHIKDSNNVDSGHAYTMPDKWADPETEMWVYCRTTHRATYFVGTLYRYGYRNVYLVENGIAGWAEKGYPLFNTYLGEFKVIKYDKKLKEVYTFRENR